MIKKIVKKFPPIKKIIDSRDHFLELSESLIVENKDLRALIDSLDEERSGLYKERDVLNQNLSQEKQLVAELSERNSSLDNEIKQLLEDKAALAERIDELLHTIDSLTIKHSDSENFDSGKFWDDLYKTGGNSGTGSYNRLAEFKANIINDFIKDNHIQSVLEIGCGDGNQLSMLQIPRYTGVDVSPTIIEKDRALFKDDSSKEFFTTDERASYIDERFDLTMSLDVIFHLTEDPVFENYMRDLFTLSSKYVMVYSSNHEEYTPWIEFRNRNFTGFVAREFPDWEIIKYVPNQYPFERGKESETSNADFYIYQKRQ